MKYKIITLFLFALSLGAASLPEFYLWQRSWTPAVREAAEKCERPLAIFAAELSGERTFRSEAPAEYWKKPDVTAVFRVRLDAFTPEGFGRLLTEINRTGCRKIELDIDVPSRRLGEYAEHLKTLREKLPSDATLSVTVLPSHLVSPAFPEVVQQTHFYVLQLHGLNVPQKITDEYSLIDPAVARQAVSRARKIGHPFKIALPSYAYILFFEPESGKFITLSAEGASSPPKSFHARLAAPELHLLRDLLKENPDLAFIWFRLPVEGDRFCYGLPTLKLLERGEVPAAGLTGKLRRTTKNALELWITPQHRLQYTPLKLKLEWPKRTGDFELAPGIANHSEKTAFAVLPTSLEVPFPGCGKSVRVATFFVDQTNHPVVKEIVP